MTRGYILTMASTALGPEFLLGIICETPDVIDLG
jgi:hypothetical protein